MVKFLATAIVAITVCGVASGREQASQDGSEQADVAAVLDALHDRAAAADFDGYFALFHPKATFLGTDRDEIWPLEAFKAYTKSRFSTGTGWTYTPRARRIFVEGTYAWFDERTINAGLGETRGTGALLKVGGEWRVVQYNLTLPIPNDLIRDVASEIDTYYSELAE